MEISRENLTALADMISEKVKADILAESTPGRWLLLEEAKEYARVKTIDTLMKYIKNGHIYAFKRTGKWIVDRQSIDEWYLSEKLGEYD